MNNLARLILLIHLAPKIMEAVRASTPVIEAIKKVAPDVLPLIRDIAKEAFPELTSAEATHAAAKMIMKPMTEDEEKRWMDRATGNVDGN